MTPPGTWNLRLKSPGYDVVSHAQAQAFHALASISSRHARHGIRSTPPAQKPCITQIAVVSSFTLINQDSEALN